MSKKIFVYNSIKALLLSISFTLISCGGGGGGGGGSSYPNIQYTGVNTQATVTDTNAADFPVTMLEGSTSSSDANPFAVATGSGNSPGAQHAAMLNLLAEQIKNDILAQQNNSDSNIISAVTQTSAGTCSPNPGSFTLTDNSTSTNLNGSFTYNNYCVGDSSIGEVILHGKMSYSGSLFLSGNQAIFQSMSISIEYLKFVVRTSTETISEEFSGSMTLTFDGSTANNVSGLTVTTNFQANGLTYKIENLVINASTVLDIRGRFFHPTYGYVDVTTTSNFTKISTNPDKYCGGSLQLTGSNGDVIDFTADGSCTTYTVCVTPNGGLQTCQSGLIWP